MKVKEVQGALQAGERFFKDWKMDEPVEVIKWGMAFVRYRIPGKKWPISTNIRTFSYGIDSVYKPPVAERDLSKLTQIIPKDIPK